MRSSSSSDGEFSIEDVRIGVEDLTGEKIEQIYAKVKPRFAVYRTGSRVAVQYADHPTDADVQRKVVAPLNGLRTQIDALIDGWRNSRVKAFRAKARRYDARVAAALTLCMEGDNASAASALGDIKDDIRAERLSWGRFEYLISASVVALFAIALFFVVNHWWLLSQLFAPRPSHLWLGAKAGTVGAFFSIALGMRTRSVLPDLRRRDNIADGVLRILIGAIAGGVVMLMIDARILPENFGIGTAKISGSDPSGWELLLVLAFVAGFVERLIPDLLQKAGPQDNGTSQQVAPQQSPSPSHQTNSQSPTLQVTQVTKVAGPAGPAAGVASGLVRLIVEGRGISPNATFVVSYPIADQQGGAVGRFPITAAQLATPGGVSTNPADQDVDPAFYRRLTVDIAADPAAAAPPIWWNDPSQPNQRSLTVTNPGGQQAECPF